MTSEAAAVAGPLASGAVGSAEEDDGRDATLLELLDAQRERALAIIAGLDEAQLRATPFPSGWSVLGLIEHLGHAERHWFQEVALGEADPLPWPDDAAEPEGGSSRDRSLDAVLDFYRAQIARANGVLRTVPWTAPPLGRHGTADVPDLRFIVLHMIEETARHLGHLDIAREVLDGRTGLGQDPL